MTKLKLGPIADDRPVKLTVELPASLHKDLVLYGELLGHAGPGGQAATVPPQKLVVPMLERFLASDRGFAKAKRGVSAGRQSGD
ncbi:DUF2274 domain-containing protein [Paracoccus versutus]|jgi:hypothetical protein